MMAESLRWLGMVRRHLGGKRRRAWRGAHRAARLAFLNLVRQRLLHPVHYGGSGHRARLSRDFLPFEKQDHCRD
jgi:hypothetical protein